MRVGENIMLPPKKALRNIGSDKKEEAAPLPENRLFDKTRST
jgi:hypothetical protein